MIICGLLILGPGITILIHGSSPCILIHISWIKLLLTLLIHFIHLSLPIPASRGSLLLARLILSVSHFDWYRVSVPLGTMLAFSGPTIFLSSPRLDVEIANRMVVGFPVVRIT